MNNFNASSLIEALKMLQIESGFGTDHASYAPLNVQIDPIETMKELGYTVGVFNMEENVPTVKGNCIITGAFTYKYDSNGNNIDACRTVEALTRNASMQTRNYRPLTSYTDVQNNESCTSNVQLSPIIATIIMPVGMTQSGDMCIPEPAHFVKWVFKDRRELLPTDYSLVISVDPAKEESKENSVLRGQLRSAMLSGVGNNTGCGVIGNKLVVAPIGGLNKQLQPNRLLGCNFLAIGDYSIVRRDGAKDYHKLNCSALLFKPYIAGGGNVNMRLVKGRKAEYAAQQTLSSFTSYPAANPVPVVAKPTPPAEPTTSSVLPVSKEADAPSKVLPLPGAGQVKPETVKPTVDIDYDQYLS